MENIRIQEKHSESATLRYGTVKYRYRLGYRWHFLRHFLFSTVGANLKYESVYVGGETGSLLVLFTGDQREQVRVLRVEELVDLPCFGDKSGESTFNVPFLTGRCKLWTFIGLYIQVLSRKVTFYKPASTVTVRTLPLLL
jgi:hypothetical protein